MGYRSDIVIAIDKEQIFKDNLLTNKLPKLLKEYKRNKRGDAFYWLFEDFKWYETYPEVREVDDYLNQLDDADFGFLRIGEDSEDNETQGSPWEFDMYIDRHIEFPAENDFR